MGNNETRMIIDLADSSNKANTQGRKQVQKLKASSGVQNAVVTAKSGSLHTLTIRNADGTSGDSYPNVPSNDGQEYEIGQTVQFTFGKVSPMPKIIGSSGSSGGGGGNYFVTGLNFFSQ